MDEVDLKLTRVASLAQPVAFAVRPGDANTFYVAEQHAGRVRRVRGSQVSTMIELDVSMGGEQGLLGIAFAPDGERAYVNFTNLAGDTRVRRYAIGAGGAWSSPRDILAIDQPFANHNGGMLAFGRDGFLYISTGDGGSGGGPNDNGQSLDTLLGKLLRIDPSRGETYEVPSDNPFVGRAGRDEILAYGLRNPWRFSFDRSTGDLWTGDVGQNAWEEVDYAAASSDGGENYGWNRMEGTHRFSGDPPANHHRPIYEYPNGGGTCSVTGGYVYRGSRIPGLRGVYVFADFCEGRLRGITQRDGARTGHAFLGPRTDQIASFGQDASGELYVLSRSGPVFRIDP